MQKTIAIAAGVAVAALLALSSLGAAARSHPVAGSAEALTSAARLSSIYDTILDARFDQARAELAAACPPAPVPACDTLREVAIWWEVQEDLSNRQLDARLELAAATAVASATRWTERDPRSAEAWFYLAGAYAPLSQWRVLRGERLTAARDGKRIKDALERALALDSHLQDAWFGIGLYHYYADVAPAALKILRFLLLLPGGNRVEGMREMLRARDGGELIRGEADFQLHWLYTWYEGRPDRALELLRGLDARHPSNPLFLQRIADVQHVYFSDHRASADTWSALLDRARTSRVALASLAEARARVGLAGELVELSEPSRAMEILGPVMRARPAAPYGVLALAHVTLGDAFARSGDRRNAIDSYNRAIETAPHDDPDQVRSRAKSALARARSRP